MAGRTVKRSDIREKGIEKLTVLTHMELAHLAFLVASPSNNEIGFDCDLCDNALRKLGVPVGAPTKREKGKKHD